MSPYTFRGVKVDMTAPTVVFHFNHYPRPHPKGLTGKIGAKPGDAHVITLWGGSARLDSHPTLLALLVDACPESKVFPSHGVYLWLEKEEAPPGRLSPLWCPIGCAQIPTGVDLSDLIAILADEIRADFERDMRTRVGLYDLWTFEFTVL